MRTRGRARSLHGIRGYLLMQVSAVSLVVVEAGYPVIYLLARLDPAKRGVCRHQDRDVEQP